MARIIIEKRICDRCGKEHEIGPLWDGFPLIRVMHQPSKRLVFRSQRENQMWSREKDIELCRDCVIDLEDWLQGGAGDGKTD
jgi:hypothetical protein